VGNQMQNSKSTASIELLPGLLHKIKILLFAGDQDLICNHLGIEMLIDALDWNGQVGLGVCLYGLDMRLKNDYPCTGRKNTRLVCKWQ
jgi:carboxypeptidase D